MAKLVRQGLRWVNFQPAGWVNFTPALTSGGGAPLTAEAQAELQRHESEGWHVVTSMPRPGFIDQMLFVLERGGQLPRLQLRMESQTIPGQRLALIGDVRNVSEQPANKVRIFMTGVELVLGVGTLTGGDPPLPVRIVYDDQPARTQEQQFPAVFAQFLSDDGRKVQQEGLLLDHTDASRRHTYTLRGLEGPHPIEVFSHRHDPLENL